MTHETREGASPFAQREPLLVGLWAFALFLLRLDGRQFWRDEQMTWWVTQLPEDAFRRMLGSVDAVMASYYYLQRGLVALAGNSPFVMRLPSAIMMGVASALLCAVGTRVLKVAGSPQERVDARRVGLAASLAFTSIPSISYYGQEARAYACALAATLAATLFLLRALDRETPGAWSWLAYALGIVAVALTHVVALSVLAAHATLVFLSWRKNRPPAARRQLLSWCAATLVSLLLLLPYLQWCASQGAQTSWINAKWKDLLKLPESLFHATAVGWLFLVAALSGLFVRMSSGAHEPEDGANARGLSVARVSLAVWAFLPPALFFATRSWLHLFLHRYLTFTLPAICVLATLCVLDVARKRPRWASHPWRAVVGALLLAALLGLPAQIELRRTVSWNRADYASPSQLVLSEQRPGDGIVFGAAARIFYSRLGFTYFARNARQRPLDVFAVADPGHPAIFPAEGCESSLPCVPTRLARVWLVTTAKQGDLLSNLAGDHSAFLRERFNVKRVWSFKDVNVALLTRGGAPGALGIAP